MTSFEKNRELKILVFGIFVVYFLALLSFLIQINIIPFDVDGFHFGSILLFSMWLFSMFFFIYLLNNKRLIFFIVCFPSVFIISKYPLLLLAMIIPYLLDSKL